MRHCPGLEKLTLYGFTSLSDSSLASISTLNVLSELNLSSGDSFSSAGVQSLIQARGNLEVLKIDVSEGSVSDTLRCLGTYCPHLRVLHTAMDATVTLTAVKALVQGCPLLEELNIGDYLSNDDEVIAAIAEFCPRLRCINLGMVYLMKVLSLYPVAAPT